PRDHARRVALRRLVQRVSGRRPARDRALRAPARRLDRRGRARRGRRRDRARGGARSARGRTARRRRRDSRHRAARARRRGGGGPEIASYVLEWGEGTDPAVFTPFTEPSPAGVRESELGILDTTALPPGSYTIRVRITTPDGLDVSAPRPLQVTP